MGLSSWGKSLGRLGSLAVTLGLLSLTPSPSFARSWSEKDVAPAAVQASFPVRQAQSRAAQQEQQTSLARLPERSTLGLSGGYTHTVPTFSFGRGPATVNAVIEHNLAADLAYRQMLTTFGQLEATVAAARLAERVAALQVLDQQQRVAEEALVAFHEACQAQELASVALATLRAREVAHREAYAQYRAGVVSRYDVLRSRTNLAQARQACAEADRLVKTTRFRLLELVGSDALGDDTLDLSASEPEAPPSDLTQVVRLHLTQRPEVQAAWAAIDEAHQRVEVARLSNAPRLDLQSDYMQRTPTGVMQGQQWNVGLGLTLPLADGGQAAIKTRQALQVVNELTAGLGQVQRLARLELDAFYEDARTRYLDLATSQAASESAREAARVSRIRYHNGLCTALELQDAEASLSDAEGQQVRARRAYAISLVHWRRATARLAFSSPPSPAGSTLAPASAPAPAPAAVSRSAPAPSLMPARPSAPTPASTPTSVRPPASQVSPSTTSPRPQAWPSPKPSSASGSQPPRKQDTP